MAEELNNIQDMEPEVSNVKVLIGIHKKSDGTKLAVTGEQYSGYDKRSWVADGIIIRNEDEDIDYLFSLAETEAHFAEQGAEDIPATDKRRKNCIPDPQFTDYMGEQYTQWQIANHPETHEQGCALCEAVKFGWLPSCGEMSLVKDNMEAFNTLTELAGGTQVSEAEYWTSTGYSADYMWFIDLAAKTFGFWKSKTTIMKVRPVKSAAGYQELLTEE